MKTFSVKNFEKFQHYKDRSPPWIKLYNELLDDYEFGCLPDASKMHLIAIWLLASRSENKIPYDPTWVARRINANSAVDLDLLASQGFIVVDQGIKHAAQNASTSLAECLSREEGQDQDIEQKISRSIEADQPERAPDRFDDFWKAYPRRDGPNPRKPAQTKFAALVRSGVDPEMLIAEAKKLATDEAKRGNVGTRFIPQAGTWLNQQRWADHAAVAFMASETGAELPIEQAVQMLARIGHWSRHAGPSPGAAGCRASADLLAKYGFGPDGRKLEQRLAEAS